ncbi:RND family efflux transporter, MFP subunit [Ectothiorhodosinus mongolicus]|uniref:RND family efflux transporter, MFP subunit n=1 Tax=Ectothiorhodosinus mongolicus TaxID=233100 RepID=A0A1R3VMM6_9GAMM|nr:efflux RND transporter periplasmic adaptor subunit [Ectothiorhodosinus mongolicus]ULX56240.1 efflux RND transporter periplasmic adaptor subunit [Ectothiorhodosinus mongolicus]SIT65744.1 RND family efflux transporter, MFP subunit [Ectothiorhodosinus mongolicus]
MRWWFSALGMVLWLPIGAQAAALSCLLEPSVDVHVGVASEGFLTDVRVDRSDVVTRGQVLARLNDGVERASVDYQRTRESFAQRRVSRTEDFRERRLMSEQELDEIATELQLARAELRERRERLALREIRSPIDGVVVERLKNTGDLINNDQVFRLMRLDPLFIEVVMPLESYGQFALGQKHSITVHHLEEIHEVELINVDRVIDPGSNTFRLRLKLDNPEQRIPSGLRCEFHLNAF